MKFMIISDCRTFIDIYVQVYIFFNYITITIAKKTDLVFAIQFNSIFQNHVKYTKAML